MKTVLVLGGYGHCGSRMVSLLTGNNISSKGSETGIQCIVAGKNPPPSLRNKLVVALDASDNNSLQSTLAQGVDFVVNLTGKLDHDGLSIAKTCLESGVNYVDMGAGSDYATEFLRLNRQAAKKGIILATNAGASPVLTTILADLVASEFESISQVHVTYSPGNKSIGTRGYLYDLLKKAGKKIRVKEQGRWYEYFAWGRGKKFDYPAPIGSRRLFMNDAAELELFPGRYGANTVTFHTGFELPLFNFGATLLARRRRLKEDKQPELFTPFFSKAAWWLRNSGSDCDALGVMMSGQRSGQETHHEAYLLGRPSSGLVIACTPITSLIRKWATNGIDKPGAFSCQELLTLEDTRPVLSQHDIVLVRQ